MPRGLMVAAWLPITLGSSVLADTTSPGLPSIDINQFLNLLIGPVGLTVGAIFVVYQFATDHWLTAKRSDAQAAKVEEIWKERWSEMKADRDVAIDIAEKAVGGYTSVADAIKERNRLDTLRLRSLQAGSPDLPEETEEPDPPPQAPVRSALNSAARRAHRSTEPR